MTEEEVHGRLALVHGQLYVGLSCRTAEHGEEFRLVGITHWVDHRRTRAPKELCADVRYLWNPTKDDGEAKPIEWYARTLIFARAAFGEPTSKVGLTCARGQHRGPSMAYAVLRAIYGLESTDAQHLLAAAWPLGDPWYAEDIDSKLDRLTSPDAD